MNPITRRTFFKSTSLFGLPAIFGLSKGQAAEPEAAPEPEEINFYSDGEFYPPTVYSQKLKDIVSAEKGQRDWYGKGGAVTALEKQFAAVTGKEKAIFLPSGTMANQLAIRILSGQNTKVFVQETSHVFRDEADAAQSVHSKRLIPLAPGKAMFTLDELKASVDYLSKGEVFQSGTGVISIENPVRRMNGQVFDIEEIKKISAYCRENKYKLHLDGARLHIAAMYTGIPVKDYASHFDTVYISLYKYLNAAGGAILCGDAAVIDQVPHLIKIFGGNTFQSWPYAAMALNSLKEIDQRLAKARAAGQDLMDLLSKTGEFSVTAVPAGTNIFTLKILRPVDPEKFGGELAAKKIFTNRADDHGVVDFFVNETILRRTPADLKDSFLAALSQARAK